jgi:hypothetical protein
MTPTKLHTFNEIINLSVGFVLEICTPEIDLLQSFFNKVQNMRIVIMELFCYS